MAAGGYRFVYKQTKKLEFDKVAVEMLFHG